MKKIWIVLGVLVLVSLFIPAIRETVFLLLLSIAQGLAMIVDALANALTLSYEAIKDTFLRLVRIWI